MQEIKGAQRSTSSTIDLELGGSAREIGQKLEKLPPAVFEKLVEAIGMAIRSRSKSF